MRQLLPALLVVAVALPVSAADPASRPHLLDEVANAAAAGTLEIEMDLKDGKVPLWMGYSVATEGKLRACLNADAEEGHIRALAIWGENGRLVLRGKGIRPDIIVKSATVMANGTVHEAEYQGFGLWRPILSLFRGMAMKQIRKIRFHTELAELMRGHLLDVEASRGASGAPPSAPEPAAQPAPASSAPPAPAKAGEPTGEQIAKQFLDLIAEVRIPKAHLTVGEKATITFPPYLSFETGEDPVHHSPVVFHLEDTVFRPPQEGRPVFLRARGRIDGVLGPGSGRFGESALSFSKGRLTAGKFRVETDASGTPATTLDLDLFALSITGGRYSAPGGVRIGLSPGSEFAVRKMTASSAGDLAGLLDFDLRGDTGTWNRQGTKVSLSGVRLVTKGLKVEEKTATGHLAVDFAYRIDYPLVVTYPVPDMEPKRVDLEFKGPMALRLALDGVGMSDDGRVDGTYSFRVPWEPIRRGSFEVLRARWIQDFPALRKVTIDLDPKAFGPCGGTCFRTAMTVTAEKASEKTKKVWFRQVCEPVGSANLVVDREARAFSLRDVKVETRCKGAVGWVINFVAPFLTKAYTDISLFKMPDGLPFTIDAVDGTETDLAISGQVHWEPGMPISKESK